MTALVQDKTRDFERWNYHLFQLAAGKKAYKHGIAVLSAGKVHPGGTVASGVVIGVFDQALDAAGPNDKPVNVNLTTEIEVEWWPQDGTIAADDVGELAFVVDDQTVTLADGGVLAGRIWAVQAGRGVAVQKLEAVLP